MPFTANSKKRNSVKARRQRKQVYKTSKGVNAQAVVQQLNATIVPAEQLVQEATEKRKETLLLTNAPHNVENKIKIVNAIRPGYMGKHGIMVRPSKINKKKVKKQLQRKKLLEQHLNTMAMEL